MGPREFGTPTAVTHGLSQLGVVEQALIPRGSAPGHAAQAWRYVRLARYSMAVMNERDPDARAPSLRGGFWREEDQARPGGSAALHVRGRSLAS